MKIKTKIRFGLLFLLVIIMTLAFTGSYYINKLADISSSAVKNNYETLQYTKNMIQAMDEGNNEEAHKKFEENLLKQEHNITEVGEKEATQDIRNIFELYKSDKRDSATESSLIRNILRVQTLNMDAIKNKSIAATETTRQVFAYITILGTICFLLSFTFVVNFPGMIANPITTLTDSIRQIANKNYKERLNFSSQDEFGDVATAFNSMAAKLEEFQNSSLSKLMFEKSRIEAIINNMQDAIIGLDEKRNILFINEVAENLLMLKKKEVLGKYAPDIALRNDLLRNLLNKDVSNDLKIFANNQESFFTKNYRIVTSDDKIIGEVIAMHNVTPFKELDSAKTNFIATVSHEFKTPISSIKMSVQLLENEQIGTLNEEQKNLLESIKDDAGRLLKITAELLNMTQAESGNIQLSILPSDPREILSYAINATKNQADQKHIKFEINYSENLNKVQADTEKTAWVLTNLISNAIRYSNENSTILLSISQVGDKVVIAVKDTGQGIAEQYKSKIFERYFRVPGTNKEGTGLGLAISKEFIEAQGGNIAVESEEGIGSTFTVTLNSMG
jgi:PAS domain S-box-containing protein